MNHCFGWTDDPRPKSPMNSDLGVLNSASSYVILVVESGERVDC